MTPLAKKTLATTLVAIGVAGVLSLSSRAQVDTRYDAAMTHLEAECRVYRSTRGHEHADVCRAYDEYAPHELHLHREMTGRLDEAVKAVARGDNHAAEIALHETLARLSDLDAIGTFLAAAIGAAAIGRALDILGAHPSLDRSFVLRDARFELSHHPLQGSSLDQRWRIANADESVLSKRERVDMLESVETRDRAMERAALGLDLSACEAARAPSSFDICAKLVNIVRAGTSLDAAAGRGPAREWGFNQNVLR